MLSHYTLAEGALRPCGPAEALITLVADPSNTEKQILMASHGMSQHDLESALDPEEIARVEVRADGAFVVWKRPDNVSFQQQLKFDVSSVGFRLKDGRLTVVLGEKTMELGAAEFQGMATVHEFVLHFFLHTVHHFLGHLRATKLLTSEIQAKLNYSQSNRYLLQMISLGESFAYYINALEGNAAVLAKLQATAGKLSLGRAEVELLEDIVIENHQCLRQTEVTSSVLSGLMDARSSIINNNVNVLLKKLTLINVVFLPLNLIAGIGGMSEFSMMTAGVAWPVAYGILVLGMLVSGLATWWVLTRSSGVWGNRKERAVRPKKLTRGN
jgi:magnesium transporter